MSVTATPSSFETLPIKSKEHTDANYCSDPSFAMKETANKASAASIPLSVRPAAEPKWSRFTGWSENQNPDDFEITPRMLQQFLQGDLTPLPLTPLRILVVQASYEQAGTSS